MDGADFLIIGGGIAGLSAAARLATHGKVIVLEAEGAIGYHSSGRSVSFSHYGIGNAAVRGLTAYSRSFLEDPPEGFSPSPLARTFATAYLATEEMLPALESLEAEMARFNDAAVRIGEPEIRNLCPVIRTGPGGAISGVLDPTGLKLDSDALLQSYARQLKRSNGMLLTSRRIASISKIGGDWVVRSESGEEWRAPILINAAGAWADRIAVIAGLGPIGLQPMRRTIIVIDPPQGLEIGDWPFLHMAASDFYMLPEAGQLLVSPVDEVADDPCDAQPDDYDIALAAHRLEQYTTMKVTRIAHRWAGLRSFVGDRVPTAGFAPDGHGFFWLVGQGGYGLQTAPAMAEIVEALVTGAAWPDGLAPLGIAPEHIRPERLLGGSSH